MDKTTAALRLEENIPSLRRYAWSLIRNSSDADDLVQDCLVRAWDRISTIRTEGRSPAVALHDHAQCLCDAVAQDEAPCRSNAGG